MVMMWLIHSAVTPEGSPTGVPMPVAPEVVCVTSGIAFPRHSTGCEEGGLAVMGSSNSTVTCELAGGCVTSHIGDGQYDCASFEYHRSQKPTD
jgi:hypothetical protein